MNNIQAVVLLGSIGDTLYPLTSQENKHFLPIGGKSLISYSLERVLDCNFKNVILVVNSDNESQVRNFVNSKFYHPRQNSCDFKFYVANDFNPLTEIIANMISQFVIQKDFILLYGDIISTFNYNDICDTHFAFDNDITIGMINKNLTVGDLGKLKVKKVINLPQNKILSFIAEDESKPITNQKFDVRYTSLLNNEKIPKDDKQTLLKKEKMARLTEINDSPCEIPNFLRLIKMVDDKTIGSKGLKFKQSLLSEKVPVQMRNDLLMANVYIISKKVFPLIVHLAPKFGSFSTEMIPFIIDYQRNHKLCSYYGVKGARKLFNQINNSTEESKEDDKVRVIFKSQKTYEEDEEEDIFNEFQPVFNPKLSALSNFYKEYKKIYENKTNDKIPLKLQISIHIFKGYHKRVNSVEDFQVISSESLKLVSHLSIMKKNENSMKIFKVPSDHISSMNLGISMISKQIQLTDIATTKITNSFIGKMVKVGKNCVIENSIILKEVQIGDNCVLKNCCIGAQSIIKENCVLNNIILGEFNLMKKDSKYSNDTLHMPNETENLIPHVDIISTNTQRKMSSLM